MEENASNVLLENEPAAALVNARGTGAVPGAAPETSPGAALFVINLCASMAPITNAPKTLPGLESFRLYQVARREDGRTRYRLRLGFFADEAAADAALSIARETYPTAFTTCLCEEDQKFARGYHAQPAAKPKIAVVVDNDKRDGSASAPSGLAHRPASSSRATEHSVPQPPTSTKTHTTPAKPAHAPGVDPAASRAVRPQRTGAGPARGSAAAPASATPAHTKPDVNIRSSNPANATEHPRSASAAAPSQLQALAHLRAQIDLSLASESSSPSPQRVSKPSSEPFRVSRGVDIPPTSLTLQADAAPQPVGEVAARTSASPAAASAAKPAPAPQAGAQTSKLPDLDSTQTIRALTHDELADESQEKWYAIQLAVSDQPVNLDAMPRLDIFEAYRLYSVAHAAHGKITHALRIGFFREEVSAEAVCGYLKTFFAAPTVIRVSIAEHARFRDPPAPKTPPKAPVLDLSEARERTPKTIPTVTMAVETPRFDSGATGTFKTSGSGVHQALNATGSHRALATGAHKAFKKTAAKSAAPPTKRASLGRTATGQHKALQSKKSLEEQLLEEARALELSASGVRKLPKSDSLLSKLFGKRKG